MTAGEGGMLLVKDQEQVEWKERGGSKQYFFGFLGIFIYLQQRDDAV